MGTTNLAVNSGRLPRAARGLTTLEMLLVMAIAGMGAGAGGQKLAQTERTETAATKAQPAAPEKERYRLDDARCVGKGQGLNAPVARDTRPARRASGPRLKAPADTACAPYALKVARF